MKKRRLIVLAGIVIAIGIGVVLFATKTVPPASERAASSDSSRPTTQQSKVPPEIKQLEATFNNPDGAVQSKTLAPGLDEQYRQQGQNPLAGKAITFDEASYKPLGKDASTIDATLSNGERYRVHFVRQDGHWYIWNTEKR